MTVKLPEVAFVPDVLDVPGNGTVKSALESGMVRYATLRYVSTAIAATGEGVVSETRTTWPEVSVIEKPVGVAVTAAHPS